MAKEELIVIKEADLTNNCPECFNQDMKLTFFQKHLITRFYNRTTSEISNKITCNKCGSVVYPVQWTENIERSFEYFQKMVIPEPKSVKFTKFFYILLVLIIVLAGAAIYLYTAGIIQF
jgi:hypothetical protein